MAAINPQQYNPGSYGAVASMQPQKVTATWRPSGNTGMYGLAAQAIQTEGQLESQRMLTTSGLANTAMEQSGQVYGQGTAQYGATVRTSQINAAQARSARENRKAQVEAAKAQSGGIGGAIGSILGGGAQIVGALTQPKLTLAVNAAKKLTS